MALPQVKQFCCGCSLETGTLIIAWIQIVGSLLYIISNIASLVFGLDGNWGEKNDKEVTSPDPSRSIGILISYILFGLFDFALGNVLLVGTKKRLPNYLNIVVIVGIIGLCICLPVIIVQSVLLLIAGLIVAGIVLFILQTSLMALSFYLLVVISSFRKELIADIKGVV